jgi:hypothetical protein
MSLLEEIQASATQATHRSCSIRTFPVVEICGK